MSNSPEGERLSVRVASVTELAQGIRGLRLVRDGGDMPSFTAGAHVDFFLPTPAGELRRSYSIASPPWDSGGYDFGVLRDAASSGGSAFVHDRISAGDLLDISPPKNFFPLADEAGHHLLLAGGIGITPMLCMARVLDRRGADFALHYAARSPRQMAYRTEIESLGTERASLYFDGGDPAKGMDLPALLNGPSPDTHVYVCGPVGMIDAARESAAAAGWPERQVHYEIFSAPRHEAADSAIEVVINSTGATLRVPADRSILDVLLDADVDTDFDCKVGICGLCAVEVLEGEAEHRDHILAEEEHAAGMFCTCVSRARTRRLVLDL
ncbi:MAG: PDR/VanB family oxidoreductase [Pseudomonadota bacterium]|nr:PDR/VanB family oxidoreductase [Pseudomonadota bacterium]